MAASATLATSDSTTRPAAERSTTQPGVWLANPWFDLLLLANLTWPLALAPGYLAASGTPHVSFWMAYFLATPHRWMSMLVAVTDSDRRAGRTGWFLAAALLGGALLAIAWALAGTLAVLALPYAVLIAAHFAEQHGVVLRMYQQRRGANAGDRTICWLLRAFVLYAGLRMLPLLAGTADALAAPLWLADAAALSLGGGLVLCLALAGGLRRGPMTCYAASVVGLYGCVILAAAGGEKRLTFALLAAVTVFHSIEYLAMVTLYARRRRQGGSRDAFGWLAVRWPAVLAWYVLASGLLYAWGDHWWVEAWFAVNLWASIMHCVFDSLLWRADETAVAQFVARGPEQA